MMSLYLNEECVFTYEAGPAKIKIRTESGMIKLYWNPYRMLEKFEIGSRI